MSELTSQQKLVLITMSKILWEGMPAVCPFDLVASLANIKRVSAKRAVRQLARMGLAERSAMFDEDMIIRGSGYMLTVKGEVWVKELSDSEAQND